MADNNKMAIRLKKGQEYFIEACNTHVEARYLGKDHESRFFETATSYVATEDFCVALIGRRYVYTTNPPIIHPVFIDKESVGELEDGKIKSRLLRMLNPGEAA